MIQGVLIPIVIVVVAALLLLWIVEKFLPELSYPARLIIGVAAIVLVLLKVAPLLH